MAAPRSTPYLSMACRVYREQLGVYLQDAGSTGERYRWYARIEPILALLSNNSSFPQTFLRLSGPPILPNALRNSCRSSSKVASEAGGLAETTRSKLPGIRPTVE